MFEQFRGGREGEVESMWRGENGVGVEGRRR